MDSRGSSAAFTVYFNEASIFGVDRDYRFNYKSNRIKFINCDLTIDKDLYNLKKTFHRCNFHI